MVRKARIAVLVSGGGTNLQALIDAQKSGIIENGEIALVISNKSGAYALERAANAGIKTETVIKKETPDFEGRLIELLEANGTDVIVLAGFMSILSERFTSHFEKRILNVHPSLIRITLPDGSTASAVTVWSKASVTVIRTSYW